MVEVRVTEGSSGQQCGVSVSITDRWDDSKQQCSVEQMFSLRDQTQSALSCRPTVLKVVRRPRSGCCVAELISSTSIEDGKDARGLRPCAAGANLKRDNRCALHDDRGVK